MGSEPAVEKRVLKPKDEDKEEIQEANANFAAAKEISVALQLAHFNL